MNVNEFVMSEGDSKIFNVASGNVTSINDITEIKKIGFMPGYDMKEGLKDTIEWFREIR